MNYVHIGTPFFCVWYSSAISLFWIWNPELHFADFLRRYFQKSAWCGKCCFFLFLWSKIVKFFAFSLWNWEILKCRKFSQKSTDRITNTTLKRLHLTLRRGNSLLLCWFSKLMCYQTSEKLGEIIFRKRPMMIKMCLWVSLNSRNPNFVWMNSDISKMFSANIIL